MPDPQTQRVLQKIIDENGYFTVLDGEDEEVSLPGVGRAVAARLVSLHPCTHWGLGDGYTLTRKGREAMGLPVRSSLSQTIKGAIGLA